MSSRVALLRMERAGLLRLPAPTHRNSNGQAVGGQLQIERPEGLLSQPVEQLDALRIDLAPFDEGDDFHR